MTDTPAAAAADPAAEAASGGRGGLFRLLALLLVLVLIAGTVYWFFFRVPGHEIWVLDQGTDRISIYSSDHELDSVIDVSPAALRRVNPAYNPDAVASVPHMIDFDSEFRYAFVAGTAGGVTIVIDAEQREVVAALQTGAGSHMAAVTPDDDAVWVAVIGTPGNEGEGAPQQLVKIPLDLDADEPVFEITDVISVRDLLRESTDYVWPSYSPVCHQYNKDGTEAWITLGPGIAQGGLFVFDTVNHTVAHAYDPAEVRANCGVAFSRDESQALFNWSGVFGAATNGGPDQEGVWYVIDVESKEVLSQESSQGVDAHGIRLNHRSRDYWQVNRGSNDGIIIDERSLEVVGSFPAGDSPDILDFSPDGRIAYITQRGPVPRSGDPHVATGDNPGVIAVDTTTYEVIAELIPARQELPADHERAGELRNDIHGVGVRHTTGNERTVVAAPLLGGNIVAINFCFIENAHADV